MKARKTISFVICTVLAQSLIAQLETHKPTFEEVISLQRCSSPRISPNGAHVLFEVSSTDWAENRFDREIWLAGSDEAPFQLTHHQDGSSTSPRWSPDGRWIAFLSKRGEYVQIHALRSTGGESLQITHTNQDIANFAWSPDGTQLAFVQKMDKKELSESREKKYGAFAIDDQEYANRQLWLIPFLPEKGISHPLPAELNDTSQQKNQAKLLIDSASISISGFEFSPDGSQIAVEHQPNPLINSFFETDISIYRFADSTLRPLVHHASYDGFLDWSPDGNSIVYESHLDNRTSNYYLNNNIFSIQTDGSNSRRLAPEFDEDLTIIKWTPYGIIGTAWQRVERKIVIIDPISGKATVLPGGPKRIYGVSCSQDGTKLALSGANDDDLPEIYLSDIKLEQWSKLTSSTTQIADWSVSQSEVITWQSNDGVDIEGVLHKPKDYDPAKKYPLLVIIHGGPTGISTPSPTPSYVYPILQWLNKGALVLQPNYRGSAGYGEKFRSLNVKNLGVGDAWDVLSGVKHLQSLGIIDTTKMGCMGWSQGGYISAFLTTNSDRFKAISVGAGISNWMTYYVNTDIHPFTRQYLKATPWSDKAIYEKTSPMSNINNASTPTLIQHGEFDRRVPTANAYELHQGLQDVGVDSKLIIYKGFGHGITKPKERLAAVWHNWQWFAKYLWNEEISLP